MCRGSWRGEVRGQLMRFLLELKRRKRGKKKAIIPQVYGVRLTAKKTLDLALLLKGWRRALTAWPKSF